MEAQTSQASEEMSKYFDLIDEGVKQIYVLAEKARQKGYDPEKKVDVPLARNLAERVIGLISAIAPQIVNVGIPERIDELEKSYGALDWRISLIIAEEVAKEKFCKFKSRHEATEVGIRIGFAYHTLGTVASPLEGLSEIKIEKTRDGKEYFKVYFSGPIRSAGGTGASVSVLITDYVRKKMGYSAYDPTEKEIKRYITELYDYHERISNLQYLPSEEEIEFFCKNLPVQIAGDPSETIEVSNYKDLERIETNRIRNGVCLVIGEGLCQKAPKLLKQLSKWGKDYDLSNWDFLREFVELQKKIKGKVQAKATTAKITPDYTYIKDLVAGRPVLSHPMRTGGFRLRYGRARTSGYSANAIHPATMYLLNNYIAIGTQLKLERPGKAAVLSSCDSIEPPIVKLKNLRVLKLNNKKEFQEHSDQIQEILFLGDMLSNYGDFLNRNQMLAPAGYCAEWWIQELEREAKKLFGDNYIEKVSESARLKNEEATYLFENPLKARISAEAAIRLSTELKVPLHPEYCYYWKTISIGQFSAIVNMLKSANIKAEDNIVRKIIFHIKQSEAKRAIEFLGVPHIVVNNEFAVIEKDEAAAFAFSFGSLDGFDLNRIEQAVEQNKDKGVLEIINLLSPVEIRDKAGVFIGARMGRPEKAKMRKLTGSPHILFPVGREGGRLRCFQSALEAGRIASDFPVFYCPNCRKETIFRVCENCDKETEKRYFCKVCGVIENEKCKHGMAQTFKQQSIDIGYYFNGVLKKLENSSYPDLIKGVRGTSNKEHIPEHLLKGIIRARHDIYVNKDGTTRYDMTQMPITHFKPKEIGTSIEKLKKCGYLHDINNNPIENEEQIIELKPQDIVLPACRDSPDEGADKVMFRVSKVCDDELVYLYSQESFYNLENEDDLVGHYVLILAPHTSAGVVGRIIGFSQTQGCLAHPMMHAATRRDCLGYDNYVPINENNSWRIEKIGEFIENLNPDEKADNFGTLKKSLQKIKTIGNHGECDIAEITKHQPRRMLRLLLEDGRKLELTENHKVYLKGKKEAKAEDIAVGDKFIINFNRKIAGKDISGIFLPGIFAGRDDIHIRNILNYLNHFEKITVKNFTFRDSFPIKFVKVFLEKHGKSLMDLPSEARIAVKRDKIGIPIRINLSNELLEVIGLYIAEGYARKKERGKGFYQVSIAGNGITKNFVKKIFLSYFGLNPSWENKDSVTFSSRIVYELFKNYLKCGGKAREKRIPCLFLNLRKDKIAALLRGYYEGDGSVSLGDIRVACDTVSEGLKYDLSFVLSRFGIYTKFYEYEKEPGPQVREFYIRKNRAVPKFKIVKITIPSNFVKKFRQIGFLFERKNKILDKLCKKNPYGMQIDSDENYAYPKVVKIEEIGEQVSYCFNVSNEHNMFANDLLVHNCDGDEFSVSMLIDVLLNFSRQYLPSHKGSTQDAPLVLTSKVIPAEVDDMVFDMDIAWKYPLEFYEATLEYKSPSEILSIPKFGKTLNTARQYEGMGFTHDTGNFNLGVTCSAYKILPSMEEKLKGQMDIADKIRAVDASDVARLVIEKHFIRDIKGNLRKFSVQEFRCVNCNEKFRRPPLIGKCTKCNGKIIFTVSEGSVVKYLEPSMSLANKYNVPSYLKLSLELTKRRIESVFGKDKEKQEGLGKWFG